MAQNEKKPSLLLHICCISCGAYVSRLLSEKYKVTYFFYNPSIFPESEYKKRLAEARDIAKKYNISFVTGPYDHQAWLERIKGYENEPEKGRRCQLCYYDRLKTAAVLAEKKGFDYFTTTLTISPHKDAGAISKIGKELENEFRIKFLDQDFKKQEGFKESVELSRKLNLYRQTYCGCEFSYRK